jgi:hypothetical protein
MAAKVTLRRYADRRLDALGVQHDRDILAVKEQAEQSRVALEHRLDGMNEFREQLRDQAARLVTRELLDGIVAGLRTQDEQQDLRIQALERRVVADEGAGSAAGKRSADRQSRITLAVAVVTTVLFLVSAVVSVVLVTRPGGLAVSTPDSGIVVMTSTGSTYTVADGLSFSSEQNPTTGFLAVVVYGEGGPGNSTVVIAAFGSVEAVFRAGVKHGMATRGHRDPIYNNWQSIWARCMNPNATGYKYWGGRGIKLYEPWHDPAVFKADVEREIGPRPGVDWTIDRKDPKKDNYEPGRIQWKLKAEQPLNRRAVYNSSDVDVLLAQAVADALAEHHCEGCQCEC